MRYVYEPFNPKWNPGLEGEIRHFDYFSAESRASVALEEKIDRAFSGRQSSKQILRAAYRGYLWPSIRPFDRVVVKDPTAVLMADWISKRYDARVLIIMRHPCAVASSIVGLGWRLSSKRFLSQNQLMDEYLSPYESILRRADSDPWARAAAVWCAIQVILLEQLKSHPDWLVCKYEDLCLDDGTGLARLCNELSLDLDSKRQSGERSPKYIRAKNDPGSTKKVSNEMPGVWKDRLTAVQIETILGVVSDFGLAHLYPED